VITAKIANITNETKKGMAVCNFWCTMQAWLMLKWRICNTVKKLPCSIWKHICKLENLLPEGLQGVQWNSSKAGNFSDGEKTLYLF
jgi:hypothetical protein